MLRVQPSDFRKLQGRYIGEALDIDKSYTWILYHMNYKDFVKFTTLRFINTKTNRQFKYFYAVTEENDDRSLRRVYLRYYHYKLLQNLATPDIELV